MSQERKPGQPGTLYLIPCPIAEDTPVWDVLPAANRAVIDSLDYFIVENVRSARRFLSKAGFGRPIDSLEFRELNEHTTDARAVDEMVRPILAGRSAGVISEAGVPGVADPGALAVARCHRLGIRVVPLIGPSSIILAVMASGLNGQSFATAICRSNRPNGPGRSGRWNGVRPARGSRRFLSRLLTGMRSCSGSCSRYAPPIRGLRWPSILPRRRSISAR